MRYTYRSCYRIILLGCSPICILKRPQNRAFQHFFVVQRPLVSLRSTLNNADLCTLPKHRQFRSCFYCFVVTYIVNSPFNGEKLGVFAFYRVMQLCVPIKNHLTSHFTQAASVAATGRLASPRARAAGYAKGVRAQFRYGVASSEPKVFLNFDLTSFALSDPICIYAGAAHYKPHRANILCIFDSFPRNTLWACSPIDAWKINYSGS